MKWGHFLRTSFMDDPQPKSPRIDRHALCMQHPRSTRVRLHQSRFAYTTCRNKFTTATEVKPNPVHLPSKHHCIPCKIVSPLKPLYLIVANAALALSARASAPANLWRLESPESLPSQPFYFHHRLPSISRMVTAKGSLATSLSSGVVRVGDTPCGDSWCHCQGPPS